MRHCCRPEVTRELSQLNSTWEPRLNLGTGKGHLRKKVVPSLEFIALGQHLFCSFDQNILVM